jgi:predicted nucleic acid-binding protein
VPTGSRRGRPGISRDLPGPIYLDASALAGLYFPEPESAALDRALRGRRDLTVSDLALTEVLAAFARRRRRGGRDDIAPRLHAALVSDLESGMFRRVDLAPPTHRAAERLLLSSTIPLRTADALHLALAMTAGVAAILTFDKHLAAAARRLGLTAAP